MALDVVHVVLPQGTVEGFAENPAHLGQALGDLLVIDEIGGGALVVGCLLYTSPSPRD